MSPNKHRRGGLRRLIFILGTAALLALAYGLWQATGQSTAADPPGEKQTKMTTAPERPTPRVRPPVPARIPTDGPAPVEVPTVPAPSRPDASEPAHEILAGMRATWECYASPHCRLGEDSDPRAEYFEAGDRIAAGMQILTEQHREHLISDAELAAAAHQVLRYDSGRARATAIEALGEVPPAREHLQALFSALDQHYDDTLFELAFDEFERYVDAGYGTEIDAFLQSNLRTGAHFPARTIARELGRFLTPENLAGYRRLADELPPESRRAALLRQSLDEYQRGH